MPPFALSELEHPIVQAPMAGGPSTPTLTAAVSESGGLGFLAAGYRLPDEVRADIAAVRAATSRAFGVNLFAPQGAAADAGLVESYVARLLSESGPLGEPRRDDDHFDAKLALLEEEHVAVASFTFGCPDAAIVERLHAAGAAVWVTVTTADEARLADRAGADALVVQGVEAGGHRGGEDDGAAGDVALLPLLQLVMAATRLPLVASGGIATGRGVAAVLAAGAAAAQLGTAFMLTPEAGTSAPHREAFGSGRPTALTRAFTGRAGRGIVNRFLREHTDHAPVGYPEVHHVTAPLRAAGRERGDAEVLNLWAGQAYPLAEPVPAAGLVRRLAADARAALEDAAERW